jgi:hypothetical protein
MQYLQQLVGLRQREQRQAWIGPLRQGAVGIEQIVIHTRQTPDRRGGYGPPLAHGRAADMTAPTGKSSAPRQTRDLLRWERISAVPVRPHRT